MLLDNGCGYWQDHKVRLTKIQSGLRLVCGGLCYANTMFWLVSSWILVTATASIGTAQTSPPPRTVWDGVYTEAQATRGVMAFGQSCAGCHTVAGEGRGPLTGEPFQKSFTQRTVGYLLEYVSTYMPNGTPGSLNEPTYGDIVSFILKSNGFPAGTSELGRGSNTDAKITPKNGSAELSANTLVRVVGCLAKSGADWVVTSGTPPERAERAAPGAEDATRPLGTRTMTLKFVLTRLDPLIGSRVSVAGLLMGADGVEGINVTAVNRVAPKCP